VSQNKISYVPNPKSYKPSQSFKESIEINFIENSSLIFETIEDEQTNIHFYIIDSILGNIYVAYKLFKFNK